MKKRELRQLAEKIAKAELIIANSTDDDEVRCARAEILYQSNKIASLEDLMRIDDLVQEILSEKS